MKQTALAEALLDLLVQCKPPSNGMPWINATSVQEETLATVIRFALEGRCLVEARELPERVRMRAAVGAALQPMHAMATELA